MHRNEPTLNKIHGKKPHAANHIFLLNLSFPVGSTYEGQLVTILHYVNGTVETYTSVVTNGMATITVKSLSPFVVLAPEITTPDTIVVDPPKTGGAGSLQGLAMVLIAFVGMTMIKRRKA